MIVNALNNGVLAFPEQKTLVFYNAFSIIKCPFANKTSIIYVYHKI